MRAGQDFVADAHGGISLRTAAEEDSQQLRGAKRAGAVGFQSFAGALTLGSSRMVEGIETPLFGSLPLMVGGLPARTVAVQWQAGSCDRSSIFAQRWQQKN